jgi:2-oxoglutarate dehydrogenase E2 component (dihydrolipoamide succinyltransferase)
MSIEIKVPAAGESITSANIGQWHVADGAKVKKGQVLVTLETDKVSNELEAEEDGTLKIIIPEGIEVDIGTVIGHLEPISATSIAPTPAAALVTSPPSVKPAVKALESVAVQAPVKQEVVTETPVAQPQVAAPVKISAPIVIPTSEAVTTTNTVSDGRTTRRKMSMLRRKIANHLVSAQQNAAILTTFNEVDMTAVMNLRKSVQDNFTKKYNVKLGFMSFFIKAVVQALKDVPQVNAMIDGTDIIENHFYDIGVAVGTEKGLIVPVLRDCDKKGFAQLELDILDFAAKARDGKIAIEELQGGVFTISNGGVYGSLLSTPILNPPQSGILGMHTIQERPVAIDGKVEIRPMMYLALSYDHRLVDGKEAVSFLIRIKECLETPTRLMMGV